MTNLQAIPFYRDRLAADGRPTPWRLEDLEDRVASDGDPFAGRIVPGRNLAVALQLEATSEPPVWVGLAPDELQAWAQGISRLWKRWGIERGETIAFFDYGSNPLVLLSSAGFVSYLKHGAADLLGVSVICNDGVASMTSRMMMILETVRPAALVVRRDLIAPFLDAFRTAGSEAIRRLRWTAVAEPEGAPLLPEVERFGREIAVPVRRVLRADAAFFFSGDCAACRLFHVDPSLYEVEEAGDGELAVTTRFATLCPAVRYALGPGTIVAPGCAVEPAAPRIAWD